MARTATRRLHGECPNCLHYGSDCRCHIKVTYYDGCAPVTDHNRSEWSRMAHAAYGSGYTHIGHRFSAAAACPNGYRMPLARYDRLMREYRAWLVFNEFSAEE